MNGPDEEFDDFLSRRKPLFRRPADELEPPEEIDRVVLRRAREAIEIDRPQRAFRGANWGAPLAIAATLLVVFTVVLHFMQPRQQAVPEVTVQQVAQPVTGAAAPADAAAWRRDSRSWLAQIEKLRAEGRTAEADAELAAYKREHRALAVSPDRGAPLLLESGPRFSGQDLEPVSMKPAVNVAITGAAGQIGYALAFRVASGQMLGADTPVNLHLLEVTPALPQLAGVVMELNDCAFPTLNRIVATDDARVAFKDCHAALLVGARPRGPGMERKDLLMANAQIFSAQGKAMNEVADRNIRVLVVGNPANTNAMIARANAKDLNPRNFTAMTRLDHNRAVSQLAEKTGSHVTKIRKMLIWGNHSSTQYPDINFCLVDGKPAHSLVDRKWYEESFIPTVQQRGAAIIKARGASSAASAASAAIDHMRDWHLGTAADNFISMAVPSDGSYGIKEGVVYSYPVTCANGDYKVVQGLAIDEFSRKRMDATDKELREERDGVKELI